jgi:hypothetical protein
MVSGWPPDRFRERQWTRLPAGYVSAEFVESSMSVQQSLLHDIRGVQFALQSRIEMDAIVHQLGPCFLEDHWREAQRAVLLRIHLDLDRQRLGREAVPLEGHLVLFTACRWNQIDVAVASLVDL